MISKRNDRYLILIAAINLLKGLLLAALGIGFLFFVGKDVDEIVATWFSMVKIDLENQFVAALLKRLDLVTDNHLRTMSGVTLVFAGVFLTEGTGLLLRKRWAEYLTLCVTASFVPIELFEVFARFGFAKLAVLAVNVAIVRYLMVALRRERVADRLPGFAGTIERARPEPPPSANVTI